jgi:hypothetical protein
VDSFLGVPTFVVICDVGCKKHWTIGEGRFHGLSRAVRMGVSVAGVCLALKGYAVLKAILKIVGREFLDPRRSATLVAFGVCKVHQGIRKYSRRIR